MAPPLLVGAVHDNVTWALPAVPVTPVGAPGTVFVTGGWIVNGRLGAELTPVPALLVAATRNV